MERDWVLSLRDQCLEANVKFFFKEWDGRKTHELCRELDGQTWEEVPSGRIDPAAGMSLLKAACEAVESLAPPTK